VDYVTPVAQAGANAEQVRQGMAWVFERYADPRWRNRRDEYFPLFLCANALRRPF
jgi:endonuclease YncB( thermonuclease family)